MTPPTPSLAKDNGNAEKKMYADGERYPLDWDLTPTGLVNCTHSNKHFITAYNHFTQKNGSFYYNSSTGHMEENSGCKECEKTIKNVIQPKQVIFGTLSPFSSRAIILVTNEEGRLMKIGENELTRMFSGMTPLKVHDVSDESDNNEKKVMTFEELFNRYGPKQMISIEEKQKDEKIINEQNERISELENDLLFNIQMKMQETNEKKNLLEVNAKLNQRIMELESELRRVQITRPVQNVQFSGEQLVTDFDLSPKYRNFCSHTGHFIITAFNNITKGTGHYIFNPATAQFHHSDYCSKCPSYEKGIKIQSFVTVMPVETPKSRFPYLIMTNNDGRLVKIGFDSNVKGFISMDPAKIQKKVQNLNEIRNSLRAGNALEIPTSPQSPLDTELTPNYRFYCQHIYDILINAYNNHTKTYDFYVYNSNTGHLEQQTDCSECRQTASIYEIEPMRSIMPVISPYSKWPIMLTTDRSGNLVPIGYNLQSNKFEMMPPLSVNMIKKKEEISTQTEESKEVMSEDSDDEECSDEEDYEDEEEDYSSDEEDEEAVSEKVVDEAAEKELLAKKFDKLSIDPSAASMIKKAECSDDDDCSDEDEEEYEDEECSDEECSDEECSDEECSECSDEEDEYEDEEEEENEEEEKEKEVRKEENYEQKRAKEVIDSLYSFDSNSSSRYPQQYMSKESFSRTDPQSSLLFSMIEKPSTTPAFDYYKQVDLDLCLSLAAQKAKKVEDSKAATADLLKQKENYIASKTFTIEESTSTSKNDSEETEVNEDVQETEVKSTATASDINDDVESTATNKNDSEVNEHIVEDVEEDNAEDDVESTATALEHSDIEDEVESATTAIEDSELTEQNYIQDNTESTAITIDPSHVEEDVKSEHSDDSLEFMEQTNDQDDVESTATALEHSDIEDDVESTTTAIEDSDKSLELIEPYTIQVVPEPTTEDEAKSTATALEHSDIEDDVESTTTAIEDSELTEQKYIQDDTESTSITTETTQVEDDVKSEHSDDSLELLEQTNDQDDVESTTTALEHSDIDDDVDVVEQKDCDEESTTTALEISDSDSDVSHVNAEPAVSDREETEFVETDSKPEDVVSDISIVSSTATAIEFSIRDDESSMGSDISYLENDLGSTNSDNSDKESVASSYEDCSELPEEEELNQVPEEVKVVQEQVDGTQETCTIS